MANRKSSHQPRFYAAPNFLKMGINYLNLSSLDNFDNKWRKVCCKVSLYKNCQRQSCSAINYLSSGINILTGGSSVPLISERKGSDPHWKQVHCRLCRGLPPYQVASWSIQPFDHNTPTLHSLQTDKTGYWFRSIGRTVICNGRPIRWLL